MGNKIRYASLALAALLGTCIVGCSSSSESAGKDTLTANVGVYPPGPSGVNKPRVGVPPFNVDAKEGMQSSPDLNDLAADQMTTLLDNTGRFFVIERANLGQLTHEQGLEGIVKSNEMAKAGQVRGVDYLLIGKVTNLRVKKVTTNNSFGLGQIGGGQLGSIGGAAVSNSGTNIQTECGVDIRLVDPSSGELIPGTASFSEYNKTDSASSMGLTILGTTANSGADIELSEDDKGRILRLALDDAVRKALPKIDKFLVNQPVKAPDAPAAPAPAK